MLPTITIAGQEFKLGCQPRVAGIGELFPVFGDVFEPIPESEWREVDYSRYVPEVMHQDGIGACNPFSACMTLRICRIMAGQLDVRLSPGHLYGMVNGGRDAGSLLGDTLKTLMDVGVCTTAEVGELVWRRRDWPAGINQIAKKYRLTEAFDSPRLVHLATGLQRGFIGNYGIAVGSDFDTDAEGWVQEGKGRGGHAMCAVGLKKRIRRGKTQWGVITVNSWGTRWGRNGFGIVPASYFEDELFTDGWLARVAVHPSDERWGPTR